MAQQGHKAAQFGATSVRRRTHSVSMWSEPGKSAKPSDWSRRHPPISTSCGTCHAKASKPQDTYTRVCTESACGSLGSHKQASTSGSRPFRGGSTISMSAPSASPARRASAAEPTYGGRMVRVRTNENGVGDGCFAHSREIGYGYKNDS